MRKFAYILLGLILVGGAIGMFTYRNVLTSTRGTSITQSSRTVAPASRSADRASRPPSGMDAGRIFEIGLNVLNAVVGIVGIWVGIAGMRMGRAR